MTKTTSIQGREDQAAQLDLVDEADHMGDAQIVAAEAAEGMHLTRERFDNYDSAETQLIWRQEQSRVLSWILEQKPHVREAVKLHCIEDLTIEETAKRMGRTPGSVKAIVQNFRKRVRDEFPDTFGGRKRTTKYQVDQQLRYQAMCPNPGVVTLFYWPAKKRGRRTVKPSECFLYIDNKRIREFGYECVDKLLTRLSELGYGGKQYEAYNMNKRDQRIKSHNFYPFKEGIIPERNDMTENKHHFLYQRDGDDLDLFIPFVDDEEPVYIATFKDCQRFTPEKIYDLSVALCVKKLKKALEEDDLETGFVVEAPEKAVV